MTSSGGTRRSTSTRALTRPLTRAQTRRLPASGDAAITRTVLPGGLRVITEHMPGVRSTSLGVWVPVGSRDEAPSLAGTSHFLEHLLFKGTPSRSALDIASSMDAVGGEFNAFTEKEHTCFYATVLDRDLPLAVDVISDVVLNALVTGADVDIERGVVLEEIAMRDDDPSDLVYDEFASAMFGDTPLGRPILGSVESIKSLTRAQIHGYYRRRYRTDAMVVSAAGNLRHTDVVQMVRRAYEGRLDGSRATAPPRSADAEQPRSIAEPMRTVPADTEQVHMILGTHGVSRHDERRFAAGVLSAALGGGMSSRLFQKVREERGLAYSIYSYNNSFTDAGQFAVYAGCHPANVKQVLELMNEELDHAMAGHLTAAEVERGKGQMRGGLVLGLEDSGSRMTRLGKGELVYGDVIGVDELLENIDAVTTTDVAEVGEFILKQPRCLTVVGPFDESIDGAV